MRSLVSAVVFLSACYSPPFHACVRCSTNGKCFGNQTCEDGICREPGDDCLDAGARLSVTDASPVDASTDSNIAVPACAHMTAPQGCALTECGTACYAVCTALKSFDAASAFCAAEGWCAANIASEAEDACLSAAVTSNTTFPPWVGFQKTSSAASPSASWSWTCAPPSSYERWAPMQPNDSDGIENGRENCATFASALDDVHCADQHPFVCVYRP